MTRKQLVALLALALGALALALAVVTAVREFPRGVFVLACIALALAAGWYGVRRRGFARTGGLAAAALLLAAAVALLVARDPLVTVVIVAACALALAAARSAFRVHVDLPGARRPSRPVLESQEPIPAGIHGEAVTLEAPLHFHIRPAALRVRIARDHPGASPSALEPEGLWDGVRVLARLAAGHDPRPVPR